MKIKLKALFTAGAMLISSAFAPLPSVTAETEETEKIRVMPLGDSITDGYSTVGGYRNTLCELLTEYGYADKVDFVGPNWGGSGYDPQHAGYSGYSIDNIAQEDSISGQRTGLSSFIDWLMGEYPADVVMLQIGTNDILSYYDLDNIGVRLENLVDTILTYIPEDGMLFLAPISCMDATNTLYINEYYFTVESMDEIVNTYNAAIEEIATRKEAEGKNIAFANVHATTTKADLYDGVHPSEEGYAKMGLQWYNYLKAYIEGPENIDTTEHTLLEYIKLRHYLINNGELTSEEAEKVDMNKDRIIDVFDFTMLKVELEQKFIDYKLHQDYTGSEETTDFTNVIIFK